MIEHPGTPGDLGRRVRRRREALGLSRRQAASRAGIDPGYLAYLEENAASPTAETVERLASALDTTGERLLGGVADPPAGPGRGVTRPRPEGLDADTCVRLISPGGRGRVAFDGPAGPTVLPVEYVMYGGAVVVRAAFGGPPDEALRTGVAGDDVRVAFETGHLDEAAGRGWSVLVRGRAHRLPPHRGRGTERAEPAGPWAVDEGEPRVRIVPVAISGWRLHRGRGGGPAGVGRLAREWP